MVGIESLGYLFGNLLHHGINGFVYPVVCRYGELYRFVVVDGGCRRVGRDGGMGRYLCLGQAGGQIVQRNQGNLLGTFVHHTGHDRFVDAESQQLTLVRLHPFARDTDFALHALGIGVGKVVLLSQSRLNVTVGLQLCTHTHLAHVLCSLVVRCLGIVPGHLDDISVTRFVF